MIISKTLGLKGLKNDFLNLKNKGQVDGILECEVKDLLTDETRINLIPLELKTGGKEYYYYHA